MSIRQFLIGFYFLFPSLIFAAPKDFGDVVGIFIGLFARLVPVVMALAILAFLFGVGLYLVGGFDREKGKKIMYWGVIGLFVMVSFWGLAQILKDTIFGSGAGSRSQNVYDPWVYDSNSI